MKLLIRLNGVSDVWRVLQVSIHAWDSIGAFWRWCKLYTTQNSDPNQAVREFLHLGMGRGPRKAAQAGRLGSAAPKLRLKVAVLVPVLRIRSFGRLS
ncbi:hypothetical protein HanIR_Chr16g0793961 [Helianthus annuus]|nr:hypothetical protein HanIR_Chr16g0793961 [Helianthus annuus]